MATLRSPINDVRPDFSTEFELQQQQWDVPSTATGRCLITLTHLHGNTGVESCSRFLQEMDGECCLVSFCADLTFTPLEKWIKLCQNFVKFKDVLDLILKFESGAEANSSSDNTNPKSNKKAMMHTCAQATGGHDFDQVLCKLIKSCPEKKELCHLVCPNPGQTHMNPNPGQTCKLTLLTDAVLEPIAAKFCFADQHVGTSKNPTAITDLIPFCHAFVHNSMHLKLPSPLTMNQTLPAKLDLLAKHVIKESLLEKHLMHPLFEAALSNDEVQVDDNSSDRTAAISESKLGNVAEKDDWLFVKHPAHFLDS